MNPERTVEASPAVSNYELDERRRALRALLMTPLLTAEGSGAQLLSLVRRHATWLRDWLARFPGWSLQIDPELARLRKTPADLGDATRPARDSADQPFGRRRYALLCLAFAALERADRQTTLGRLAEEVQALCAGDPALAEAGLLFDLGTQEQRRDIVEVVRLLLALHVIVRVQGDEQQYLQDRGDVLYSVNRPVLAAVLQVQRGPSSIEAPQFEQRLRALVEEPMPETEETRNRRLRTSLVRKLLDDPVVYYEALTPEERAYLSSQRHLLLTEIENATGLVREVRREGIALADERGDASDVGFPEEGTDGHSTLLLAEHLAAHARSAPGALVSRAALEQFMAKQVEQHRAHWRKDVSTPGAEVALTAAALDRLEALRLVRREGVEAVVPLAAVARYTLEPLTDPESSPAATPKKRQLGLDLDRKRR